MSVVLAIEPDSRQARTLRHTIRQHVDAELVLTHSKDEAIDAINRRVPDLILVSALMSPIDKDELVAHLRTLDAPHLQTLTVPLLARPASEPTRRRRGLFKTLKSRNRHKQPAGCDPEVFAQEIVGYLERAQSIKAQRDPANAVPSPWADQAFVETETDRSRGRSEHSPSEASPTVEHRAELADSGREQVVSAPAEPAAEPAPVIEAADEITTWLDSAHGESAPDRAALEQAERETEKWQAKLAKAEREAEEKLATERAKLEAQKAKWEAEEQQRQAAERAVREHAARDVEKWQAKLAKAEREAEGKLATERAKLEAQKAEWETEESERRRKATAQAEREAEAARRAATPTRLALAKVTPGRATRASEASFISEAHSAEDPTVFEPVAGHVPIPPPAGMSNALPIIDAEFEPPVSAAARPSDEHDVDAVIDIPRDALEDRLEGMVEIIDLRDVSPGRDPHQVDDPVEPSPDENAWLMRTIAKLRADLTPFCKAPPAETDTAGEGSGASTISAETPETAPADRPVSPRVVIPPTTVDRRPDVTKDHRPGGTRQCERTRLPSPLAIWAHRASPDRPAMPDAAGGVDDADVARGLIHGLLIPYPVASVRYAGGCRIHRVRVAPLKTRDRRGAREPLIVLSRSELERARVGSSLG